MYVLLLLIKNLPKTHMFHSILIPLVMYTISYRLFNIKETTFYVNWYLLYSQKRRSLLEVKFYSIAEIDWTKRRSGPQVNIFFIFFFSIVSWKVSWNSQFPILSKNLVRPWWCVIYYLLKTILVSRRYAFFKCVET